MTAENQRRWLRSIRSWYDLGQLEFAERLGVSRSGLANWETGSPLPDEMSERLKRDFPAVSPPQDDEPDTEPPNVKGVREDVRGFAYAMMVAIPLWRGVSAGSESECFFSDDAPEMREMPAFLTAGAPDRHVLCVATGMSMSPRIEHAERAIVRLDPDVPPNHIVVARSEENRNYIKKLVVGHNRQLELHSLNEAYSPILNLTGWELKGGVTAILHGYKAGYSNIEWDDGRYLGV